MESFPVETRFIYPWRKYQKRVLDELWKKLDDRHLHIIAPPGSGKTVLGLEVARQINKPVLILAPTIAIRNQWIDRFCQLFLQTTDIPEWISTDIRNPGFMTVSTYQGLHAACYNLKMNEGICDEDEVFVGDIFKPKSDEFLNKIANLLKKQKVGTIVVDEAHHLKNEWWATLDKIKDRIDPIIVGLTATPPYDVTFTEWQHYVGLNGPVDMEISVPELIIEGDLCPHQDYVYFSKPERAELDKIDEFRENAETLFKQLCADGALLSRIQTHPAWLRPEENTEWIYSNISFYSSMLIFINANNIEIPHIHFKIIGNKQSSIPSLNYRWMETLLDFFLYKEKGTFDSYAEYKTQLENRLRRFGVMDRGVINFSVNKKVTSLLSTSISKLKSIVEIVGFESEKLGHELRLVVLTDFIRKELLSQPNGSTAEPTQLGIVPIFELLRRTYSQKIKIGVLSGSLIIIPASAEKALLDASDPISRNEITLSDYPFDNNFKMVQLPEKLKNRIVALITMLFQQGDIEVLIGTKSLLGEGWDAPAINTLILASFVGSFVLSNQMRGRAIRTMPGNKNKTGNIWHLVCVDKHSLGGGPDYEMLRRRFKGFVGVTVKNEPRIENNIDRMSLPDNFLLSGQIDRVNKSMLENAERRDNIRNKWEEALKKGNMLIEEIRVPYEKDEKNLSYKELKSMYFNRTIAWTIATLLSSVSAYFSLTLNAVSRVAGHLNEVGALWKVVGMVVAVAILFFGGSALKALRLFLRYRDIGKDFKGISETLLRSMIYAEVIHSDPSNVQAVTLLEEDGALTCFLNGGTRFEQSAFIMMFKEILDPVENPRYIILRKSKLGFINQTDYHAIPDALARNKKSAQFFANQWEYLVGNCELIFARNIEGRKILLKSRALSLSSQLQPRTEQINSWRN